MANESTRDTRIETFNRMQDEIARSFGFDPASSLKEYAEFDDEQLIDQTGGKIVGGAIKAVIAANPDRYGELKSDEEKYSQYWNAMKDKVSDVASQKLDQYVQDGLSQQQAFDNVRNFLIQSTRLTKYSKEDQLANRVAFQRNLERFQAVKGDSLGYADVDIRTVYGTREEGYDPRKALQQTAFYETKYDKTFNRSRKMSLNQLTQMEEVLGYGLFTDIGFELFAGDDRDLARDFAIGQAYDKLDPSLLSTAGGIALSIVEMAAPGAGAAKLGQLGRVANALNKTSKARKLMGLGTKVGYFVGKGAWQDASRNDALAKQYDINSGNLDEFVASRAFDAATFAASEYVAGKYLARITPALVGSFRNSYSKVLADGSRAISKAAVSKALARADIWGGIGTAVAETATDMIIDTVAHNAIEESFGSIDDPFFTLAQRRSLNYRNLGSGQAVLNSFAQRLGARAFSGVVGSLNRNLFTRMGIQEEELPGTVGYAEKAFGGSYEKDGKFKSAMAGIMNRISNVFGGTRLEEFDSYKRQYTANTGKELTLEDYVRSEDFNIDSFTKQYLAVEMANNSFFNGLFDTDTNLRKNFSESITSDQITSTSVIATVLAGAESRYTPTKELHTIETAETAIRDILKTSLKKVSSFKEKGDTDSLVGLADSLKKDLSFLRRLQLTEKGGKFTGLSARILQTNILPELSSDNQAANNRLKEYRDILKDFLSDEEDINNYRSILKETTPEEYKRYADSINSTLGTQAVKLDVPHDVGRIRELLKGKTISDAVSDLEQKESAEFAQYVSPEQRTAIRGITTEMSRLIREADKMSDESIISDMNRLSKSMSTSLKTLAKNTIDQILRFKDDKNIKEGNKEATINGLIMRLNTLHSMSPVKVGDVISEYTRRENVTKDFSKILRNFDNKKALSSMHYEFKKIDTDEDVMGSYLRSLARDSYRNRVARGKLDMMLFSNKRKTRYSLDDLFMTLRSTEGDQFVPNHALFSSRFNSSVLGIGEIPTSKLNVAFNNSKLVNGIQYEVNGNMDKLMKDEKSIRPIGIAEDPANYISLPEMENLIGGWIYKLANVKLHDGSLDLTKTRDEIATDLTNEIKNYFFNQEAYIETEVGRELTNLSSIITDISFDGEVINKISNNTTNNLDALDYDIKFNISGIDEESKMGNLRRAEKLLYITNNEIYSMSSDHLSASRKFVSQADVDNDLFVYGDKANATYQEVLKEIDSYVGIGHSIEDKIGMIARSMSYDETVDTTRKLIKKLHPVLASQLEQASVTTNYYNSNVDQLTNLSRVVANQVIANSNEKYTIGLHDVKAMGGVVEAAFDPIRDANSVGNFKGIQIMALSKPDEDWTKIEKDTGKLSEHGLVLLELSGAGMNRQAVRLPKKFLDGKHDVDHNNFMVLNLVNSLNDKNRVGWDNAGNPAGVNDSIIREIVKPESYAKDKVYSISDIRNEFVNQYTASGDFARGLLDNIISSRITEYDQGTIDKKLKTIEVSYNNVVADLHSVNTRIAEAISKFAEVIVKQPDMKETLVGLARGNAILSKYTDQLESVREDSDLSSIVNKINNIKSELEKAISSDIDTGTFAQIQNALRDIKSTIGTNRINQDQEVDVFRIINDMDEAFRPLQYEWTNYNNLAKGLGIVDEDMLSTYLTDKTAGASKALLKLVTKAKAGAAMWKDQVAKMTPNQLLGKLYSYIIYGDHVINSEDSAKRTGAGSVVGTKWNKLDPMMSQGIDEYVNSGRARVVILSAPEVNGKEIADGSGGLPDELSDLFSIIMPKGDRQKMTYSTSLGKFKLMLHGNDDWVGEPIRIETRDGIQSEDTIRSGDIVLMSSALKDMHPGMLKFFGIDEAKSIKKGNALVWDSTKTIDNLDTSDHMRQFIADLSTHANLTSNNKQVNISSQAGLFDKGFDSLYKIKVDSSTEDFEHAISQISTFDLYTDTQAFWKQAQSKMRISQKHSGGSLKIASMRDLRTNRGDVNILPQGKPSGIPEAYIGHEVLLEQLMLYSRSNRLTGKTKDQVLDLIREHKAILNNSDKSSRQIGNNDRGNDLVMESLAVLADDSGDKKAIFVEDNGFYYANFTRFPAQRPGHSGWFVLSGIKREATRTDLQLDPFYVERMQNADFDGDKAMFMGFTNSEAKLGMRTHLEKLIKDGILDEDTTDLNMSFSQYVQRTTAINMFNHISSGNKMYSVAGPARSFPELLTEDVTSSVGRLIGGTRDIDYFDMYHYTKEANGDFRNLLVSKIDAYESKLKSEQKETYKKPVVQIAHVNSKAGKNTLNFFKREGGKLKSIGSVLKSIPSTKLITRDGKKIHTYLSLIQSENAGYVKPMVTFLEGDPEHNGQFLGSDFGMAVHKSFEFGDLPIDSRLITTSTMSYISNRLTEIIPQDSKESTLNPISANDFKNLPEFTEIFKQVRDQNATGLRAGTTQTIYEQAQNAGVDQAKNRGAIWLDHKYKKDVSADYDVASAVRDVLAQSYAGSYVKLSGISGGTPIYKFFEGADADDLNKQFSKAPVDDMLKRMEMFDSDNINYRDFNTIMKWHSKSALESADIQKIIEVGSKYTHLLRSREGRDNMPGRIYEALKKIDILTNKDKFFHETAKYFDTVVVKADKGKFLGLESDKAGLLNIKMFETEDGIRVPKPTALIKVHEGIKGIQNIWGKDIGELTPRQSMNSYKHFITELPVLMGYDVKGFDSLVDKMYRKSRETGDFSFTREQIAKELKSTFGIDMTPVTDKGASYAARQAMLVGDITDPKAIGEIIRQSIVDNEEEERHILTNNKGDVYTLDSLISSINHTLSTLTAKDARPEELERRRNLLGYLIASSLDESMHEAAYLRTRGYDIPFVNSTNQLIADDISGKLQLTHDGVETIVGSSQLFKKNRTDIPTKYFSSQVEYLMKYENKMNCGG